MCLRVNYLAINYGNALSVTSMLTPQLGTLAREALITAVYLGKREYECRADRHQEADPDLKVFVIRIVRLFCCPLNKTWWQILVSCQT